MREHIRLARPHPRSRRELREGRRDCRVGTIMGPDGTQHEKFADIAFLDMPTSDFGAHGPIEGFLHMRASDSGKCLLKQPGDSEDGITVDAEDASVQIRDCLNHSLQPNAFYL